MLITKPGPPLAREIFVVTCTPDFGGAGVSVGFVIAFALCPLGTCACSPTDGLLAGVISIGAIRVFTLLSEMYCVGDRLRARELWVQVFTLAATSFTAL